MSREGIPLLVIERQLGQANLGITSAYLRGRSSLNGRIGYRQVDGAPPLPLPDTTVITPEGDLDIARMADFRASLRDAAGGDALRLVIDLSQVSFIDSSGLGALVEMHNRLQRDKRQLAVVAPGGTAVAVLINLAGLRDRLPVFETRRAALKT